jgi:SAM-dependent methyltransferase
MTKGPPRIFDRQALRLHGERARRIAGNTFLVRDAAQGMAERLTAVQRTFEAALELNRTNVTTTFLQPLARTWSQKTLDGEDLNAGREQFDLIVSVLSLHSVNDLPGVLLQLRQALKPDGLFLATLFGGNTLFELRDAFGTAELATLGGVSPRVAPFADVRDLGGLLQRAGFALPVADVEKTIVRYRDLRTLVADLRAMGETNALSERSRKPLSRDTVEAASAQYAAHHADPDGKLRASFDVVYLTGWAPHASQPQPLRPGSATSRLAQALKTTEHSAGERTPKR